MRKTFASLAAVMILTIGTVVAASAGGAIGVLDMDKLFAESPKVKVLDEQLAQKGQELYTQLAAEKIKLTPEEFRQKQDEASKVFLQTKLNFEAQIDASVRQAAEQVAKEKNLRLIVEKNAVVFGGTDITREVMDTMQ